MCRLKLFEIMENAASSLLLCAIGRTLFSSQSIVTHTLYCSFGREVLRGFLASGLFRDPLHLAD